MPLTHPDTWPGHSELEPGTCCFGPFCAPGAVLSLEPRGTLLYLHWRAQTPADLLAALQQAESALRPQAYDLYIEFVPPEFEAPLLAAGFQPHSEFVDAWIRDLDAVDLGSANPAVRPARQADIYSAAAITRACAGASRGFNGETAEWAAGWLAKPENAVFLAWDGDQPVGVVFCALYHASSRNTEVCWVRELAVLPSCSGRGFGRALTLAALRWGRERGAGMSFLAVDRENANAIHLYESIGYCLDPGRGQVNLIKKWLAADEHNIVT